MNFSFGYQILNCSTLRLKIQLINTLEKESEAAIDWFVSNKMIVYPNKFQAMVVN